MGYLLLLALASSYRIIKYFNMEYLIKDNFKNKILYYSILIVLIILSVYWMENNNLNISATMFFIFAIISSIEIQILYYDK